MGNFCAHIPFFLLQLYTNQPEQKEGAYEK